MKIAICDDEITDVKRLEALLCKFLREQKTAAQILTFTSAEAFLSSQVENYDVIFLDVLIGEKNGMDIARRVWEKNKETILVFVSAFVEYAPSGFEVNAFRYLLKGRLDADFPSCMDDVVKKREEQQRNFTFKTTQGDIKTVKLSQVLFFESAGHNIWVQVGGEEPARYKMYGVLASIEKQLPSRDFLRVQRSYIVNLRSIVEIRSDKLLWPNGESITCSRKLRGNVVQRFFEIQGE